MKVMTVHAIKSCTFLYFRYRRRFSVRKNYSKQKYDHVTRISRPEFYVWPRVLRFSRIVRQMRSTVSADMIVAHVYGGYIKKRKGAFQ
jgi:hypothetical protein